MKSAGCPTDDALAAFASGSRDTGLARDIEAHIADCRDCRAVVGAVILAPTMDGSTVSFATDASADATASRRPLLKAGDTVARYVILEHAGAGAMGSVYKAYDSVLERAVALKLLHDGGTAEKRDRMLREAQALAKVSHPNVIAVHDVGTLEHDVYVAMEFVHGKPFNEWLRTQPRPTPSAILDAFVEAGLGLGAAHAAGLVHRDFKPSNALLGDDGRVRVIDFGLARGALLAGAVGTGTPDGVPSAMEGSSSGLVHAELTEPGVVAGTPRYMAPEQRRLETLSPATDQFAFCVALWEAMAGAHPFVDAKGALHASAFLGAPREGGTLPGHVRRALERGLARDPEARFPSMDALVRELRRDPKARWRRGLAAVAVIVALGAAAGLGALRGQPADVCGGGAARMNGVWDAHVADAITVSLARTGWSGAHDEAVRVRSALDAYAKRWVSVHRDACVSARVDKSQSERVFDLRSQCLERRLAEARTATELLSDANRELAIRASTLIGALGDPDACSAANVNEHAQALPHDPALRERIARIRTEIDRATVLREAGRLRDARAVLASATTQARDVAYDPLLAEALLRFGEVEGRDGDGAAGLVSIDDATLRAGRAGEDRLFAEALLARAELLTGSIGRPASTLDLAAAMAGAVAHAGVAPDLQSRLQSDLARAYDELGRHEEALPFAREGVRISESAYGKYAETTANSLRRLASIERIAGAREEAKRDSADAVARLESVLGPEHPGLYDALLDQASTEMSGGDAKKGEALVRRAIRLLNDVLPDHPKLAHAYRRLGSNLALQGKSKEAETVLEKAAELAQKETPPDYVILGDIYGWLGDVVRDLRGVEASRAAYSKVRDAFRASGRTMDPFFGDSLTQWASGECDAGHTMEAAALFDEARVILGGREDFWRMKLLTTEADCMVSSKRPRLALSMARDSITRLAGMNRPADLADAHFVLARALWDLGEHAESLKEAGLAAAALEGTGRSRQREIEAWAAKHGGARKGS